MVVQNMKIAILLHGQPRLFEYTYKRIKEEFNLPGVEFDFFAHFWRKIGYSPTSTESDSIDSISLLEQLNIKKYSITNYDKLDNIASSNEVVRSLAKGSISVKPFNPDNRYHYGQYVSLLEAFNLMEQYERDNDIEYDIVIKVRSDWVYKDKSCYASEVDYLTAKKENYLFTDVSKKIIKTIYVNKKIYNNKEYVRSFDPCIIATRSAAPCFFKYWFLVNLNSLIKDVLNPIDIKLHVKHDFMVGEIANLFDIQVEEITLNYGIGRCHRVVNFEDCKQFWITDDKNISIILPTLQCNIEEEIQKQLLTINQRKSK
jgi:hypothetical protein